MTNFLKTNGTKTVAVFSRVEKEKNQLKGEIDDLQSQIEHAGKNRGMSDKMSKQVEMQISELNDKLDSSSRTIVELNSTKSRLQMESTDLTRQLEDAESKLSQLNKEKQSLLGQLDDARKSLEDETRVGLTERHTIERKRSNFIIAISYCIMIIYGHSQFIRWYICSLKKKYSRNNSRSRI